MKHKNPLCAKKLINRDLPPFTKKKECANLSKHTRCYGYIVDSIDSPKKDSSENIDIQIVLGSGRILRMVSLDEVANNG
jgi:hypothetical protein